MRISVINNGFYPEHIGGAEVQIHNIFKKLEEDGFEVHYVNSRCGWIRGLRDLIEFRPDCVYQRGRKSSTILGFIYCIFSNTSFIFNASMDIDFRVLKKSKDAVLRKVNILKKIYRISFVILEDISTYICIRKSTEIIVQNEFQRSLCRRNYKRESTLLRSYHDIAIQHDQSQISNRKPTILWLATIKKWKRPEMFIEICKELKEFQVILAGNIVDESYMHLIKLWKETCPNLTVINSVDYADSLKLIMSSTIFVNTSLGNEGFPNTYVMSWLNGNPVLSMGFDPDSMIVQEDAGYLANSIQDASNWLKNTLMDDERMRYYKKRSVDLASRFFSRDKTYQEYKNMFSKYERIE